MKDHDSTRICSAVILSTYNSPKLLEFVLAGYAAQSTREFKIVVADDGSGAETRRVIEAAADRYQLPIHHVWHPDDGFQKCAILNRAIELADADYLIFSDGDCVPSPEFVATHMACARSDRFLSGGCIRLPAEVSDLIQLRDVLDGRATRYRFLSNLGLKANALTWLRLAAPRFAATLTDRLTPTRASWNGHNSSCWRSAALRINGFDERMGYGGEDREFGERLIRVGVRSIQVRHQARCVHLHHDRSYVCQDVRSVNDAIRAENRRSRALTSDHGIRRTKPA